MIYETKSPKETRKLAEKIALEVLKTKSRGAVTIALEGELGAGKTTFVQGFVKGLGIEAKVKSPTFVLMKKYGIPGTGKNLFHLDCYRLRDYKDLKPLGIKEIFKNPGNIILIEWAERVAEIIPKESIKIHFDHVDEKTRKINITGLK